MTSQDFEHQNLVFKWSCLSFMKLTQSAVQQNFEKLFLVNIKANGKGQMAIFNKTISKNSLLNFDTNYVQEIDPCAYLVVLSLPSIFPNIEWVISKNCKIFDTTKIISNLVAIFLQSCCFLPCFEIYFRFFQYLILFFYLDHLILHPSSTVSFVMWGFASWIRGSDPAILTFVPGNSDGVPLYFSG